jgi:hypothetical protein
MAVFIPGLCERFLTKGKRNPKKTSNQATQPRHHGEDRIYNDAHSPLPLRSPFIRLKATSLKPHLFQCERWKVSNAYAGKGPSSKSPNCRNPRFSGVKIENFGSFYHLTRVANCGIRIAPDGLCKLSLATTVRPDRRGDDGNKLHFPGLPNWLRRLGAIRLQPVSRYAQPGFCNGLVLLTDNRKLKEKNLYVIR